MNNPIWQASSKQCKLGNNIISKPTSIQSKVKYVKGLTTSESGTRILSRSSLFLGEELISVGAVPEPKLAERHRRLTVFSSSHPQWMSLESLRVGLEGDHHTFTYVSGAHHKQGSFRRNPNRLGAQAPRVTSQW